MRREVRVGLDALPRRRVLALAGWSLPEALPAAVSGLAVARAVDDGFLVGRPLVGLAWLGTFVLAGVVGAVGSRQVYRRVGELVEPFRDDLVGRVVGGALRHTVAGSADDGAVARLTRQIELVRDAFAGLIVLVSRFVLTVAGVVVGLTSTEPLVLLLVLPPFLLGVGLYVATLGVSAARQRAAVRAEERLAAAAGPVLGGVRDLVAAGAEEHGAALVAAPIAEQAAAERALARVAALRTLCFAMGGWLPLVAVLLAGPWLVSRGVTAGAIMGGLTYVLFGLQPALRALEAGLAGAGLRFVVTLGRILDAAAPPAVEPAASAGRTVAPTSPELRVRGMSFAYGPHAEPVLRDVDLSVRAGEHVAVVGPSGIGKSTLAGLLCGLLRPGSGEVRLGGVPVAELPAAELAALRVLIPQETYVFTGSIRENLTYLRPAAPDAEIDEAVRAVGAETLVARLGGPGAAVDPTALSAGERQLLALARAYLSPAPVVVLDEATCHLDPVAEARAEQAFAERPGTLVVIAHRISSALRADRILVMNGADLLLGTHDELLARSPLYADLVGHWADASRAGASRIAQGPRAYTPAGLDLAADGVGSGTA